MGAIMPFYLESCPGGWAFADGTDGTPDLRGTFIRGMYGDQNSRDVSRSLGDFQEDQIQAHKHTDSGHTHNVVNDGNGGPTVGRFFYGDYGGGVYQNTNRVTTGYANIGDPVTSTGGTIKSGSETRPKNVALIYCMKTV